MSDPVFVFGARRSGSTVFRLMLQAHDALSNPGEADFLFDHLHREPDGRWRYDSEGLSEDRFFLHYKLDPPKPDEDGLETLNRFLSTFRRRAGGQLLTLNIHRHVDTLVELLPEARIVHLLRDPRDVARSGIGMGWAGDVYHGVWHWIDAETGWDRVAPRLRPDQVLELRYENLFRDIEGELRRVCAFLDVPYSPAMLTYHETSTYGPPDPKLIEQWRRKMTPREIGLVEARIGDLLTRRGYAPSGAAPVRPSTLGRLALQVRNKVFRARFQIRRYGLPLFALEKITDRLGLVRINRRCRARIRDIHIAYLK